MHSLLFTLICISTIIAKQQNITIQLDEITCQGDDFIDNLRLQVWDKNTFKDDMLTEKVFNATNPHNITILATSNGIFEMKPYLICQHTCNGTCVRSRFNIPNGFVGGICHIPHIDLNGTFEKVDPC